MDDLIVLAADKSMSATMEQLLTRRQQSLGIRPIKPKCIWHSKHDAGCLGGAAERLRGHCDDYRYALVVFDRHGCGQETQSRVTLQVEVEQKLQNNGWPDRSKAIVIDPELEAWVWNDSPYTARVLGWEEGYSGLRAWLHNHDLWPSDALKPPNPQEAFRRALRAKGKPRSSTLFKELARSVGLSKCQDPAFIELRLTLGTWFPKC